MTLNVMFAPMTAMRYVRVTVVSDFVVTCDDDIDS